MHHLDTATRVDYIYRDKKKCVDKHRVWLATIWEDVRKKDKLGRDFCARHNANCLEISVDRVDVNLINNAGVVDRESPTVAVAGGKSALVGAQVLYVANTGKIAVSVLPGFSGETQCLEFVNFDPDPSVRPEHSIITVHVPPKPQDFSRSAEAWVEVWRNHIESFLQKSCIPLGR